MCFIGGKDVKVDFYSTVDPWLDGFVLYMSVCVCPGSGKTAVCVFSSCLPAFVHSYVSVCDCKCACFWM